MKKREIKLNKGFSLIEVLIVVFLAAIVFASFYSVSTVGTRYIIEAKNRLAASALVNEQMEIIRNLPYDKIGIQGAVDIPGNLLQDTSVTANGKTYEVSTSIRYFDDPMDGVYPADTIPNDYKIVRIIVSWNDSNGQHQEVSSTSRVVPPGLETSVGGSPLSINIISNDGGIVTPVAQASVHITNNTVSPAINDTIQTDNDGHIMLPAAIVASGDKLIITKNGYETVATMDTTATFIPIYKHVDVIAGALNQYSFEQNKLANLHVRSADYQNNPVGNIGFSIGGGKIIANDNLGNVVYNMANTTGTTDSTTGEKEFAGISPGAYNISMNANANYEFIDFDPAVSPAILASGSDYTYTIRVAPKTIPALFLKVSDSVDNAVIAGADVTLTDGSNADIFTSKKSSLNGIVFYPDVATPLMAGSYTLKIVANGYVTKTQPITIDNTLTSLEIKLARS
jgi:prepilin-type N-terminal cleavage/methylation domain-containing protein